MKKNLKFLFLSPFLMAILCESDVVEPCGFQEPEAYVVNVENISETYAVGETFWINSEISSELINGCNNDQPEFVTDNTLFRDAIFILKLNNLLTNLNAEVSQDYDVEYAIGEVYAVNNCSGVIDFLPELTDDNLSFEYRLGLSVNTPGDYCIVSATSLSFLNTELENNAQIFEAYNTLGNLIKFESCSNIFTRAGTENHYFFTVE